jgi:hypothetical protein
VERTPVYAGFRQFPPRRAAHAERVEIVDESGAPDGCCGVSALSAAHLTAMKSRRQSVRVVPAAADRVAPVEVSMLMNIVPILSRRRSAGIRHNIAQFCQE